VHRQHGRGALADERDERLAVIEIQAADVGIDAKIFTRWAVVAPELVSDRDANAGWRDGVRRVASG
jgi:hypothetical protein